MLENLEKYKVVLASNSPRRKELLEGLGIEFEVRIIQGIDESYPEALAAREVPVFVAKKKADAYLADLKPDE